MSLIKILTRKSCLVHSYKQNAAVSASQRCSPIILRDPLVDCVIVAAGLIVGAADVDVEDLYVCRRSDAALTARESLPERNLERGGVRAPVLAVSREVAGVARFAVLCPVSGAVDY